MNNKLFANIVHNGLILPEVSVESYEFGGMTPLDQEIIIPDGNAIPFLPQFERQSAVYFDTWGCVSSSFDNCVQTSLKARYNVELDFCDRDLIVLSGTKPRVGNSGEKVGATAIARGLIPQSLDDFDMTSRDPKMTEELFYSYIRSAKGEDAAEQFKKDYTLILEWVPRERWEDASRCGALQVYVKAWVYDETLKRYINPTGTYNHAVMMADYKTCKIFDTYEPMIKQLDSWESAYPLALKINIIKKNMDKPIIQNNTLVQLTGDTLPGSGKFGLFLDNSIKVGDLAKLLASFYMRNNGNTAGKTKPLSREQWEMFTEKPL